MLTRNGERNSCAPLKCVCINWSGYHCVVCQITHTLMIGKHNFRSLINSCWSMSEYWKQIDTWCSIICTTQARMRWLVTSRQADTMMQVGQNMSDSVQAFSLVKEDTEDLLTVSSCCFIHGCLNYCLYSNNNYKRHFSQSGKSQRISTMALFLWHFMAVHQHVLQVQVLANVNRLQSLLRLLLCVSCYDKLLLLLLLWIYWTVERKIISSFVAYHVQLLLIRITTSHGLTKESTLILAFNAQFYIHLLTRCCCWRLPDVPKMRWKITDYQLSLWPPWDESTGMFILMTHVHPNLMSTS